jgi:hypothetical protein
MTKPKPYTDDELDTFDAARKSYPGVKRGLMTEFASFQKANPDWQDVIPLFAPAIHKQKAWRRWLKSFNRFCPVWKNFKTWTNNRCWEEEFAEYDDYIARQSPLKRASLPQDSKSPTKLSNCIAEVVIANPDERAAIAKAKGWKK